MSAHDTAVTLLGRLHGHGVRDVVLSPGSRSAPLAYAAYAADQTRDLRLHTRIDERTAGFLALGLTRSSHRPVAVVMTSGTAVGNLLPAVMEAAHSGYPLIVLSADRPARLRGTGANQTTLQPGIFAAFAPGYDLPPDPDDDALTTAVAAAAHRNGPTHLNVQFEGDLTPGTGPWWLTPPAGPTAPPREPGAVGIRLDQGKRTVVVAGDDAGPAARVLAESAGWPLLAEPTSGSRVGANAVRTYRLLLDTYLRSMIERVVVVGHPTLSRPVIALISDPDVEVLSVRGRAGVATDPAGVATQLDAVPGADPPTGAGAQSAWLDAWRAADAIVSRAVDELVTEWAVERLHPYEVAREVARAVGPDSTLVCGSSNPVRDLDLMSVPYPPHQRRLVIGNRGLAGIDGTLSTAIGAALGRRRPHRQIAYVGDLTFLHDLTALVMGPDEPRPDLSIVVLNDGGGAIFASLEHGAPQRAAAYERVFGTAHHVDLGALCAATGTTHARVTSVSELRARLARHPQGVEVLEVTVSRATRRAEADELARVARRIDQSQGPRGAR